MIKRFLRAFSCVFILMASLSLYASINEEKLKLSIIDVDYSLFYTTSDGDDVDDPNFYDSNVMLHAPVLVEYHHKKSILFFLPPVEGSQEEQGMILNYNLGNNKMNVVGFIHGLNKEVLSVFGYESDPENTMILVMTKSNDSMQDAVIYSTFRNSIIEEDNGLYIRQYKLDKISNPDLTNCADGGVDYLGNPQVCKYKNAASVKKYFDEQKKIHQTK